MLLHMEVRGSNNIGLFYYEARPIAGLLELNDARHHLPKSETPFTNTSVYSEKKKRNKKENTSGK